MGSYSMKKTWHQADRIQGKVRSARSWHLAVLIAEQGAPPLAIVLCLRMVQLVLGVRIDPSRAVLWAGALACTLLLAWVVLGVRRHLHTRYEIAQGLDTATGLDDSFSTAWFLLENPGYATGPQVAAQLAYATSRVSEIRLPAIIPLPTKRLSVVAVLVGVLAVTVAVRPGIRLRLTSKNEVEPVPASRTTSSGSNAPANQQKQVERELPGKPSPAQLSHNIAGGLQAPSSQRSDRITQSFGMRGGGDHWLRNPNVDENRNEGVPYEVTSHAPASDGSGAAKAPAVAPAGNANSGLRSSHEDRTGRSGASKTSLISQWLAPIKRLLDTVGRRPHTEEANTQPANRAADPAGNNVASDRLQASSHETGSNQRAPRPEYSSVDASAQQASSKAAGSLPPSIGGGHPKTAPHAVKGYSTSVNVIDLVDPNPSGDAGHTRTLATQNTGNGQHMDSSDFDHHPDSGRQVMQDDVPLAYRHSLQTYLEHAREQLR